MLEPIFISLIKNILEVENSHKESSDNNEMLSRNWEFIFQDFDGWTVLHVSTNSSGGYWLYPMLCPVDQINDVKDNKLPNFSISPSCAAYGHVMSGDNHWLEPHWKDDIDRFNTEEIQLFFDRQYYGYPKGREHYVEFNQLITHPLDLHWAPQKNSYCSLNRLGEEIEKIKIIQNEDIELILIRRKTLDKLLYLGNWGLIRYVSFNRFNSSNPNYDESRCRTIIPKEYEAIYEIRQCGADPIEYIEFRGAEILRPKTPKNEVLSYHFDDEEDVEKKYAEFIVKDWKNNKIRRDYSISPDNFANYFIKSNLPFETSPIFFKAEVLDKYKSNPDKYELKERRISCRGGWFLETYDINEYNQVHTYAVYLARLPYQEQLYWKSYNEEPKGTISKRAYQTDFEAKWPDQESPIDILSRSLKQLSQVKIGAETIAIWSPKGGSWDSASKGLHCLTTENSNHWHDFIISLANSTNEGFQKKQLFKVASAFGNTNKQTGTLGLIKYILEHSGNSQLIPEIHGVLNDLQIKRGKGKAHGSWDTPQGSLIEDASKRLEEVISSIQKLKTFLEGLTLNLDGGEK